MTDIRLVEDQYGQWHPVRERELYGTGVSDVSGKRRVVQTVAADITLTAADSGKVFLVTAADKVATLPATDDGIDFTFVTAYVADGAVGFSVRPVAADKIQGGGLTAADDKDVINTYSTDALGDQLRIVGDGTDGWWIINKVGTWARET